MTDNKKKRFLEISDLLFYSIEQGDEELARELISFITKEFFEFRVNKKGKEVIYPNEFYSAIFQANELVCIKPRKTISYLNGSIFLDLLIDSYQETIISDKSYNALWIGLRQALFYDRDDIIMSYWKNAHQHFGLFLQPITPEYENSEGKIKTTNKKEVLERESERAKFLEFNYVIGGLLLFQNKYKLLKNILFYTNQTPPVYYLIPGSLSEIINNLLKIKEDYKNPFHYEQMYSFPDIDGVNKGAIIRFWIKKYFAVLFLRQYKLKEYYTFQNIFGLPTIPTSLSEMKEWESELNIFKDILSEILKDTNLLKSLELKDLSNKEWYKENKKQYPIDLIDEIIKKVKLAYEEKKITQPVSEKKKEEFYNKSKEIVTKSISKFKQIENKNDFEDDIIKYFLKGRCELFDKTAFSDDQDVSYLNSDTIIAQTVIANTSLTITWTFLNFIKERYSFERENIFKAINEVGFNFDNYVIISFGVYLKHFTEYLNIEDLKEQEEIFYYKNSPIININTHIHPDLIGSFLIIKKNELPKLIFNDISEKDKDSYKPELLEKDYFLYANIINLNDNKSVRDMISLSNSEDLREKVLACILINWEIKWKKSSQIYQFKVFEQFNNPGKPNSISDLKKIEEK